MEIKKLLEGFELLGNSLIIENLDNLDKELKEEIKTASGIILTTPQENIIALKKGKVLKAGRGYVNDQGIFIENPIKENAIVYYKNVGEYEAEGIRFLGAETSQIAAYKNE